MSRLNSKVYVAIGEKIYAFERMELRVWLYAKGFGGVDRESDPEVMGEKLKSLYSVKRRAFPAALHDRLCFCVDGFKREDYLALWEAMVKGAEQFEAAVKELMTRGT